ncbi:MAG: hypothetical protein LQ345_000806 [Seirophora villosa]|nr:MAG: hypothetical protein LQ345_000806 [Seirophora villosa]
MEGGEFKTHPALQILEGQTHIIVACLIKEEKKDIMGRRLDWGESDDRDHDDQNNGAFLKRQILTANGVDGKSES